MFYFPKCITKCLAGWQTYFSWRWFNHEQAYNPPNKWFGWTAPWGNVWSSHGAGDTEEAQNDGWGCLWFYKLYMGLFVLALMVVSDGWCWLMMMTDGWMFLNLRAFASQSTNIGNRGRGRYPRILSYYEATFNHVRLSGFMEVSEHQSPTQKRIVVAIFASINDY